VPYHSNVLNIARNKNRLVKLSKLLLVDTPYTADGKTHLRPILSHLKRQHIIQQDQDVFTDFLVEVFRHTKQLADCHGFFHHFPVEFVITVPTVWSQKASRILQAAVESAIGLFGFGMLENGSVKDLFIISEPEAAATFLLAKDCFGARSLVPYHQ
jgi:hypothetical protein